MRAALAVAAAAVFSPCSSAGAAPLPDFMQFRTPSGNIGCAYAATSLRCDIRSGIPHPPPRPKNCDLDWGGGYAMNATGPATVMCAGDTAIEPSSTVIPYGTTWHRGAFSCTSQPAGLRCTNASRHGFFLSKDPAYTF